MASAEPAPSGAALLHIEAVYCPRPGSVDAVVLTLPAGATLADALRASGLLARHGLVPGTVQAGVWGRAQPPDHGLHDRDRVELYRPLQVDPKEARRQRYQKQKTSRTAGAKKEGAVTAQPGRSCGSLP